jgi:hypothetical protein
MRQLSEKNAHRPRVGGDVVDRQQQPLPIVGQIESRRANQQPTGEVERQARVFFQQRSASASRT